MNQDGYISDGYYGGDVNFDGDGENGSVGANADHHIDGGWEAEEGHSEP